MATKKATVYKHVFLDYSEYQRLLEANKRNEELLAKIKNLEKKVGELQDQEGQGHYPRSLLRKEYNEQLKTPLLGITDSITLPPSAQPGQALEISQKEKEKDTVPWFFLGPPKK